MWMDRREVVYDAKEGEGTNDYGRDVIILFSHHEKRLNLRQLCKWENWQPPWREVSDIIELARGEVLS